MFFARKRTISKKISHDFAKKFRTISCEKQFQSPVLYVKYISSLISTRDISLSAEEIGRKAQDRNVWKIMIEHVDKYG